MFKIISIAWVLLTIVNYWDSYYYPNYFFSHTGLAPERLTLILSILSAVVFYPKISGKKIPKVLILTIFLIVFMGSAKTVGNAAGILAKTVFRNQDSPDKQLTEIYGSKYEFVKWISSTVSENKKIVIPPQTIPWRHTGSYYLMQAWLYPANVVSASEKNSSEPRDFSHYDFVVISSESYNGIQKTWPDFLIPAKKIIIYDWDSRSGITYEQMDYRPEDWVGKEPWGLIVPGKI